MLSAIVQFYKQHGDNEPALRYLNQKRDVYKQAGNYLEEGNTLFEIGQLYGDSEQAAEAIKAYDAAVVSYREGRSQLNDYQNGYQVVANLLKIATAYGASQQKAIAVYEEALKLSLDSPTLIYNTHAIVSSLGQLYLEMKTDEGKAKATQLFESTLEVFRTRNAPGEADLRSTIGDVYRKVGDTAEARAAYDQALAIYRTKEFGSYRHTELLNKMGALAIEAKQQTSLADFFVSQADSARQAGDVQSQAFAFELAGIQYRGSREVEKAIGYFEQARALYHTAGRKTNEVTVLRTLATLYDSKGDKQKAKDLLRQANQLDPPLTPGP